MQRSQQMRQSHLEIGQQREVGACPGDLLEVEYRGDDRLLEHRPLHQQIPSGSRQDRPTGKRLATLESNQLRQGHVHAVLAGDVLCQPAPASKTHRASRGLVTGGHAPGGAGTGDDDQLSAIECRKHRSEGVPGIFADEDGRPAPPGIEGLHAPAGLDEALLIENAVGREKDLSMDMADTRVRPAERGVQS